MLHPSLQCSSVWLSSDLTCKLTGFMLEQNAKEKVQYDQQQVNDILPFKTLP